MVGRASAERGPGPRGAAIGEKPDVAGRCRQVVGLGWNGVRSTGGSTARPALRSVDVAEQAKSPFDAACVAWWRREKVDRAGNRTRDLQVLNRAS